MAVRVGEITRLSLHRPDWLFSETSTGCTVIPLFLKGGGVWLCCHTCRNFNKTKSSEGACDVALCRVCGEQGINELPAVWPNRTSFIKEMHEFVSAGCVLTLEDYQIIDRLIRYSGRRKICVTVGCQHQVSHSCWWETLLFIEPQIPNYNLIQHHVEKFFIFVFI